MQPWIRDAKMIGGLVAQVGLDSVESKGLRHRFHVRLLGPVTLRIGIEAELK